MIGKPGALSYKRPAERFLTPDATTQVAQAAQKLRPVALATGVRLSYIRRKTSPAGWRSE
jgi:nitrous oxidase accessory protein NosD